MALHGIVPPTHVGSPRPLSRDSKDDYLLAYAESGGADYLVTYDGDLLALDGAFAFRIVTPPDFLAVLRGVGDA